MNHDHNNLADEDAPQGRGPAFAPDVRVDFNHGAPARLVCGETFAFLDPIGWERDLDEEGRDRLRLALQAAVLAGVVGQVGLRATVRGDGHTTITWQRVPTETERLEQIGTAAYERRQKARDAIHLLAAAQRAHVPAPAQNPEARDSRCLMMWVSAIELRLDNRGEGASVPLDEVRNEVEALLAAVRERLEARGRAVLAELEGA